MSTERRKIKRENKGSGASKRLKVQDGGDLSAEAERFINTLEQMPEVLHQKFLLFHTPEEIVKFMRVSRDFRDRILNILNIIADEDDPHLQSTNDSVYCPLVTDSGDKCRSGGLKDSTFAFAAPPLDVQGTTYKIKCQEYCKQLYKDVAHTRAFKIFSEGLSPKLLFQASPSKFERLDHWDVKFLKMYLHVPGIKRDIVVYFEEPRRHSNVVYISDPTDDEKTASMLSTMRDIVSEGKSLKFHYPSHTAGIIANVIFISNALRLIPGITATAVWWLAFSNFFTQGTLPNLDASFYADIGGAEPVPFFTTGVLQSENPFVSFAFRGTMTNEQLIEMFVTEEE